MGQNMLQHKRKREKEIFLTSEDGSKGEKNVKRFPQHHECRITA
jgi:hypothetical protein